MIVEFLGLPGSGKTTLATELGRQLSTDGADVVMRGEVLADERSVAVRHLRRARYVAALAIRTPRLFLRALRLIRKDGQQNLRAVLKVCWNIWCVLGWYGWLSRHRRQAVVIVDQGLAQAVLSIRLSAVDTTADWRGFLREYGRIDAVVITECDPSLLKARLEARKGQVSRLSEISHQDRHWQVARRSFAEGCVEAEALFPTIRVRNETAEDTERLVAEVADWLEALAERRSGA
ncbi:MAG: AAA family ATPase [Pararhodobacter sp.]|nr:AAA family ATPase [Pararhodobacter sp.]